MTHKNGVQELNSQHAIALESERLRLAEGANQEKKKALDDANARFELERDRMTQSHEAAAAAYKNEMQELQCKHAAELESERLRLIEEAETEKKAALDAAADQFKSEYDRMTQSHKEAAAANENQMRELQSQHAAELESERLRLAEEADRAKKAALDDATAWALSRSGSSTHRTRRQWPATRMTAGGAQSQHAAELESERCDWPRRPSTRSRRRWMTRKPAPLSWRASGCDSRGGRARSRRRWMTQQLTRIGADLPTQSHRGGGRPHVNCRSRGHSTPLSWRAIGCGWLRRPNARSRRRWMTRQLSLNRSVIF